MRVWSRGLGRVELGFDLTKVVKEFNNNELTLSGKTEPPVSWDFEIKMDVSEVWLLTKLAASKPGLRLFSKYMEYKVTNRKILKERYQEAKKTRTGVQVKIKTPPPRPPPVQKVTPVQEKEDHQLDPPPR